MNISAADLRLAVEALDYMDEPTLARIRDGIRQAAQRAVDLQVIPTATFTGRGWHPITSAMAFVLWKHGELVGLIWRGQVARA